MSHRGGKSEKKTTDSPRRQSLDKGTPEKGKSSSSSKGDSGKKKKLPKMNKKEFSGRVKQAVEGQSMELDISGLNLVDIPGLPHYNWNILDLGFNLYTTWPNLNLFTSLQELTLSGCSIQSLGDDLQSLGKLQKLTLNGNHLSILQESISQLTCLLSLNLANNHIRRITPKISSLRSLEEFILCGNPLEGVPPEFGELKFMETLDLSSCGLKELPDALTGMCRLLELNLGSNQLTALPQEFGLISRVVTLNLSDNQISALPVSMGACTMLNVCLLDRNPIQDQDLLTKYNIGTDHLVDYLGKKWFAIQQQKKKQMAQEKKKNENTRSSNTGSETPPPARVSVGPSKQELSELRSRENKFRTDTQSFTVQCRDEVAKMKKIIVTATSMEQLLPVARAVRELIPNMEEARKHIPPVAGLQQAVFRGDEDQVTKLKKSVIVRVREFEGILDGITVVLSANASFETLLELSGVIAGSLTILRNATEN